MGSHYLAAPLGGMLGLVLLLFIAVVVPRFLAERAARKQQLAREEAFLRERTNIEQQIAEGAGALALASAAYGRDANGDGMTLRSRAAKDALRDIGEQAIAEFVATLADRAAPSHHRKLAVRTLWALYAGRAVAEAAMRPGHEELVVEPIFEMWASPRTSDEVVSFLDEARRKKYELPAVLFTEYDRFLKKREQEREAAWRAQEERDAERRRSIQNDMDQFPECGVCNGTGQYSVDTACGNCDATGRVGYLRAVQSGLVPHRL